MEERVRPELFRSVASRRISVAIAEQIRARVRSGDLRPGDRLASEEDLAERFGVSHATVRDAFPTLQALGVLQVGTGTKGGATVDPLVESLRVTLGRPLVGRWAIRPTAMRERVREHREVVPAITARDESMVRTVLEARPRAAAPHRSRGLRALMERTMVGDTPEPHGRAASACRWACFNTTAGAAHGRAGGRGRTRYDYRPRGCTGDDPRGRREREAQDCADQRPRRLTSGRRRWSSAP